jgi:hypothetical protein
MVRDASPLFYFDHRNIIFMTCTAVLKVSGFHRSNLSDREKKYNSDGAR